MIFDDIGEIRRQKILRASARIFARVGLYGASMLDLTRASGIAPATFYRYFESKEQVFRTLYKAIRAEIDLRARMAVARAGEVGVRAGLRQMIGALVEFSSAFPDEARLLIETRPEEIESERGVSMLPEVLIEMLANAAASGELEPVSPDLSAGVVWGLFSGLLRLRQAKEIATPEALVEMLDRLCWKALAAVPSAGSLTSASVPTT